MPLQWRHQIWQSLEEGAGKRCSECGMQENDAAEVCVCVCVDIIITKTFAERSSSG